jgi:8-oxo-dGTP pyrophosphatase MutT (NUDIX family)
MKLNAHKRLLADRMTGVGAGVLFVANDTGRMLFLLRSPTSESPNTWCCPGGGVDPGESVEQGVRRECQEEIGFSDAYDLMHMHSDEQPGFTYHNHWAVVPSEFEPTLNDEHTDYQWTDSIPQPIHPGLLRSLLAYKEANEIRS